MKANYSEIRTTLKIINRAMERVISGGYPTTEKLEELDAIKYLLNVTSESMSDSMDDISDRNYQDLLDESEFLERDYYLLIQGLKNG